MAVSLPDSTLNLQLLKIVQEHWTQHRSAILLSQLGSRIDRAVSIRIKEEYGNLAGYLRKELPYDISLLHSSVNPTIVGAVPADAATSDDEDPETLLLYTPKRPQRSSRRFHPALWAAFVKELAPDARRHLSIGPPPRFRDLDQEATLENSIEIPREYIIGTDENAGRVHESISTWLQKNRLEEVNFLAGVDAPNAHLPSDDLLGRLVVALSPDELRRLSIPMDIVRKLRQQSV